MPGATLPLYLNVDGIYAAEDMALPWRDTLRPGVIATPPLPTGVTDPLKVGPTSPAAMGVEVQPGACYVRNLGANDSEAYYRGGLWRVAFTAAQQVAIDAAHATLGRFDRVYVEVLDAQFAGASNLARIGVVKGTPAASPAVPALPRNCLELAYLTVAAAATTVAAGAITDVRSLLMASAGPGARVFGVGQGIPNTTPTALHFVAERFDQAILHDPAFDTRLVARSPSLYAISASIAWNQHATGWREIDLRRNGTQILAAQSGPPRGDGWSNQSVSTLAWLDAGDYVEVVVSQSSGTTLVLLQQDAFSPEFSMVRVA